MEDLSGRVAVVTGAASGLGLAMARHFADAGMRVVLSDVEGDKLDDAVAGLRDEGREALGVVADVADAAAVQRLGDAAYDALRLGRRAVQQRRRGQERALLGAHRRRLDVGHGRRLLRCRPRHPVVRARGCSTRVEGMS